MTAPQHLDGSADVVSIGLDDLQLFSEAVMLRLQLRVPELRRIGRIRSVLGVASELNKALSTYVQHAMVDCQGSHGTADLSADTAVLFDAFARYAAQLRVAASDYRSLARDFGVPLPEPQNEGSAGAA